MHPVLLATAACVVLREPFIGEISWIGFSTAEASVIHPSTRVARVSDVVGDGVFATVRIPKGTIVWTQDALDRIYPLEESRRLEPAIFSLLDRYAHINEKGHYVLCWDSGKLINHSCDPSLRGVGTWFQVARRDIHPGEEITCDYAECNLQRQLRCHCPGVACRGAVHADDLLRFATQWDEEALALLSLVPEVDQPLWPYLLDARQARAYVEKRIPLPSFRALYSAGMNDARH